MFKIYHAKVTLKNFVFLLFNKINCVKKKLDEKLLENYQEMRKNKNTTEKKTGMGMRKTGENEGKQNVVRETRIEKRQENHSR